MSERPASGKQAPDDDDEPVLPQVSRDERSTGWGDDPEDRARDEEWYRRERPPHHE